VTPRQIFEYPTVAALADVITRAPQVQAEEEQTAGAVPLIPVQHWFFEQRLPRPGHFNQALLLEVDLWLTGASLRQACAHLLAQHDALRLRFTSDSGAWRQALAARSEPDAGQVDLFALVPERRMMALEDVAGQLQASLDLASGPLLRAALFTLG